MTRAELLALAERVENASKPDRALEEEIDLIAYDLGWRAERKEVPFDAPRYTSSIDAAASLVPDGWYLLHVSTDLGRGLGSIQHTPSVLVLLHEKKPSPLQKQGRVRNPFAGSGFTQALARARLAAALRARAEEAPS